MLTNVLVDDYSLQRYSMQVCLSFITGPGTDLTALGLQGGAQIAFFLPAATRQQYTKGRKEQQE